MKSTNGLARLLALLISLVMVAAACSSDNSGADAGDGGETATSAASDDGGSDEGSDDASGGGDAPAEDAATGEPIRIGAVTSESGLTTFPESAAAAQLVFDRYNAAGGLDGRPIELIVVDDQDTAEGAASAARSLVEEQMVDALCCGGSIVDCTTNGGYYAEMEMEVVMGVAACAEAATVHPVNTGPFLPALHALDYFAIDLGLTNICAVGQQAPITELFVNIFFPLWSDVNGIELNVITSAPGEDLTPTVTKLAADGCEAVFAAYTEPVYQSFFQIVNAQGLGEEIEFAMLTSGYSLSLLDAAGPNLEGVYAASEFAPYTGDASTSPMP